jgi:cation:H+ antiporter
VGNIVGSNMFNTLAVVGLAGMISPATVSPEVLTRDLPVVALLTAALVLFAVSRRRERVINRWEGGVLAVAFVTYTAYLLATAV